eukprot:4401761-Alexandrium_andersonii.AAC.1
MQIRVITTTEPTTVHQRPTIVQRESARSDRAATLKCPMCNDPNACRPPPPPTRTLIFFYAP